MVKSQARALFHQGRTLGRADIGVCVESGRYNGGSETPFLEPVNVFGRLTGQGGRL